MKLQNNKGFTLIELLVVITIIGILATGATTVYTSQIQKARDTTRINDIKALQSAVEQVYQDRGEYPAGNAFITDGNKVAAGTYMPRIPRDPKNGQTCNNGGNNTVSTACVYSYQTDKDDNGINQGKYVLSTGFEALGKVQSDGTRDGGLPKNPHRWEVGNGILGSNPLDTDIEYPSGGWTGINLDTLTGALKSNLSGNPTLPNELITIHGS